MNVWLTPTGDLSCSPSMCPDWELNRRPFGSQSVTQYTEPHQPGLYSINILKKILGMSGEKEGEKHQCMRETVVGCLSRILQLGTWPQPRHVP